jgi:transcriptional regulator GlxA family with amidase domain
MSWLKERAETAKITASVCTGSDVLAQAGLLDGRKATTNKMAYKLVVANNPKVNWVYEARWVDDGDRVTSSGVSAGIDMSLHLIERLFGTKIAERVANGTEFNWQRDPAIDPFAKLYE